MTSRTCEVGRVFGRLTVIGLADRRELTGEFVEHRMSTSCHYDMSLTDSKCDGCKHRGSGEAYDKRIRKEGLK